MLRRIGIFCIVFFALFLILGIVFYPDIRTEWIRAVGMISIAVGLPLGVAFLFLNKEHEKMNRAKRIIMIASMVFVGVGVTMKYLHGFGANIFVMTGTFFYCFAYGPLGFKAAYLKWKPFASKWSDTTILSIINFLGINLVVLGALFKIMHWPYAFYLMLTGGILAAISLLGWNRKFGKEVILRKQAEDRLRERNKEITDSIHYARRIQNNLLPKESYLEKVLKRMNASGDN